MKCPCEKCICMPICKNKNFEQIFKECSIIDRWFGEWRLIEKRPPERLIELYKILDSNTWRLNIEYDLKNGGQLYVYTEDFNEKNARYLWPCLISEF